MSSTPAAIATSMSPLSIAALTWCNASMDEPQNRFTTFPGTDWGKPASTLTERPISMPWGPSGKAHPMTKSSICSGLTVGFRSTNPFTTWAARSSGRMPTISPFFTPIGERVASIITA